MGADVSTGTAIRRMQNAALERALVRGDHDGRYVAFAGTLESLRRTAAEQGSTGLFAPLLACTVLATDDSLSLDRLDQWSPALGGDESRVEGALLAYSRFDIDTDRAARLAGRSTVDFESILRDRSGID